MKLDIRKYGDPVLREKAREIGAVDDRIRRLADDMIETMHAADGIGLAAQQVGETVSLCVVDVPEKLDTDEKGARINPDIAMPIVLVNPKIAESSRETDWYEEGCLSFPEIRAPVERPSEIVVRHLDRDGRPVEQRLRGLVGRCVQHEMDHLNAVLIVDRMSSVKRIALAGRLKKLKKATQEALGLD